MNFRKLFRRHHHDWEKITEKMSVEEDVFSRYTVPYAGGRCRECGTTELRPLAGYGGQLVHTYDVFTREQAEARMHATAKGREDDCS